MTQHMTVWVLLVTACGGARSSPRPDDCSPAELGWSDADGCFFDAPAAFFSDDRQDCGLSNRWPNPIVLCHAPLYFEVDTVMWYYTDVSESFPYECDGNTLTFERDGISATWDASMEVLTWNGLDYLPSCPRQSQARGVFAVQLDLAATAQFAVGTSLPTAAAHERRAGERRQGLSRLPIGRHASPA